MGRYSLSETQRAYWAGFLDGEGCFRINNGSTAEVSVSNTFSAALHELQAAFGGHVAKKLPRLNRRPCFQWRVQGEEARECVLDVEPYLFEKRRQAAILLIFSSYPKHSAMRTSLLKELSALKRVEHEYPNHITD